MGPEWWGFRLGEMLQSDNKEERRFARYFLASIYIPIIIMLSIGCILGWL